MKITISNYRNKFWNVGISHTMGVISSVRFCCIWKYVSWSWNTGYLGVLESSQFKYLYGELFICRLHFFYEQSFYIMLCEVEENENQIKKGPIHSSGHITGHPLPSGTLSWRWHSPYERRKQLLNPSLGIPSDPAHVKSTCKYVLNAVYWFSRGTLKPLSSLYFQRELIT